MCMMDHLPLCLTIKLKIVGTHMSSVRPSTYIYGLQQVERDQTVSNQSHTSRLLHLLWKVNYQELAL